MSSDKKCPLCGMEMVKHWPDAVEPDCHIEGSGQCWARQVTQLRADKERLQVIVDKLDKFADDEPGCIGDEAWLIIGGCMRNGMVKPDEEHIGVRVRFEDSADAHDDTCRLVADCYSTRQAAEAAAEDEGQGEASDADSE